MVKNDDNITMNNIRSLMSTKHDKFQEIMPIYCRLSVEYVNFMLKYLYVIVSQRSHYLCNFIYHLYVSCLISFHNCTMCTIVC